jgi:hypothetical protein
VNWHTAPKPQSVTVKSIIATLVTNDWATSNVLWFYNLNSGKFTIKEPQVRSNYTIDVQVIDSKWFIRPEWTRSFVVWS